MDRKQLDIGLPLLYALLVIICSPWIDAALKPVAIIGALLLAGSFAVLRPKMLRDGGEGRERRFLLAAAPPRQGRAAPSSPLSSQQPDPRRRSWPVSRWSRRPTG